MASAEMTLWEERTWIPFPRPSLTPARPAIAANLKRAGTSMKRKSPRLRAKNVCVKSAWLRPGVVGPGKAI